MTEPAPQMITKTFCREELREMLGDKRVVVLDEIVENTRWSILHRFVFLHEGKHYETHYRVGATEYQDERPWDDEETVKCTLVEPYERTIIDYRPVS